jgi:RNA polymerase II subunit A small phosphatase-like protein
VDRLLVILDLDETLVYAADKPLARAPAFAVGPYAIYKRPHLDAFLEELLQHYGVAIWTASGRDYATGVVSKIVPWHGELAFLWTAIRCTRHFDHETRDHNTIKKLRKVRAQGFDLGRVLVVDDSPEKHVKNYGNLIHIQPFVGDESDDELPRLLRYIHTFATHPNVRSVEKRHWRNSDG